MASLKYCDTLYQVGFLKKPEESAGFCRGDSRTSLKGSHIRYALTHNPTIHDSLVKQFWQTATALTLADGTLELRATIDTIAYTITEASVRSVPPTHPNITFTFEPDNEPTEHTFDQPSTGSTNPLSTQDRHMKAPKSQTQAGLSRPWGKSHCEVGNEGQENLENILKRRNVVLTTSEDEELEDQGRIFKDIDDDPLVSFVTPTKPSGEAQEEEISRYNLGSAKDCPKVAFKSTGSGPVSSDRGQREGKAQMIVEETQAPKRTKEQIQQEEASLAKAMRLQNLEEEETAKQVHWDALLAKSLAEEEEFK
ncbi:hypothetical protein Tco_1121851 [Tanacetum coccineum]|uniref:Uncharacterized protein n=1 Tax=Tanacetum coccineum TaxID=301880 RepID=A0ABQ5IZW3_9ASTR